MERKALYRKYRPQTFDDMYGQDIVTKTIANAISNNAFSHSYIFAGNKGSGKTSLAKIFAKAINCEKPNGYNPCNKCAKCLAINNNSSTDILELDAASNNGVDDVRDIIESINYLPNEMKKKVIIIDEAHMLTNQSWNALLKTIEEPPEWVVFILATTEYHKIPATIISRCQRYDFHKIPVNKLETLLEGVAKKENITISKATINNIAKLADGAARDALSILDQLVSFDGNNVKDESVNQLFGIVNIETKINLVNYIFNGDANAIIQTIDQFYNSGINFAILCSDVLDILMDKLLYLRTKNASNLTICNQNNINSINFSNQTILLQLINLFNEQLQKIKFAPNPKLVMEIACINALKLISGESPSEVANQPIKKETSTSITMQPSAKNETPASQSSTGTTNIWSNQLKQQVVSSPSNVSRKTQQFSLEEIIEEQNAPKLPSNTSPFKTKEIIFESEPQMELLTENNDEGLIIDDEPNNHESEAMMSTLTNNATKGLGAKLKTKAINETDKNSKTEPYIKKVIDDYDEEFKDNFFAIVHNRDKDINTLNNSIFGKVKVLGGRTSSSISKLLSADRFLLSSPNGSVAIFKTKNEALRFNEIANDLELQDFIKKYFKSYKVILGVDMDTAKELKAEYNKIQANDIKDVKIIENKQDTIKTKLLDILNDEEDK